MRHTLEFLTNLASNNDQSWFLDHIGDYEQARTEVSDLAFSVFEQLLSLDPLLNDEVDPARFIGTLVVIKPKKSAPYLTHFAISISPVANQGNEPVYYLHIDPNGSYLSIKYVPDVFGLQVMRNFITKNLHRFEEVLSAAFSAGFALNEQGALTSLPKGYAEGAAGERYLKLKQYEVSSPIDWNKSNDELMKDIVVSFDAAMPVLSFLREGLGLA